MAKKRRRLGEKKSVLCLAGKNRIAVSALHFAASRADLEVVALPNSDDFGEDTWQPSFLRAARDSGVEVIRQDDLYEVPNLTFISLEYNKIIEVSQFQTAELYNIHFSLLPYYRGTLTSVWPLLNGETLTGVTLHQIDCGVDTGNIVSQREIKLTPLTTARELYDLYQDAGIVVLHENLDSLLTGQVRSTPQPANSGSYFPRSEFLRLDKEIDFAEPAERIRNFVRSLYFPEYQTALFRGNSVRQALPKAKASSSPPGTIISSLGNIVVVSSADFEVELLLED